MNINDLAYSKWFQFLSQLDKYAVCKRLRNHSSGENLANEGHLSQKIEI